MCGSSDTWSFLLEDPELDPVTRSQPSTLSLARGKYFHWSVPTPGTKFPDSDHSYLLRGSVWLARAMWLTALNLSVLLLAGGGGSWSASDSLASSESSASSRASVLSKSVSCFFARICNFCLLVPKQFKLYSQALPKETISSYLRHLTLW